MRGMLALHVAASVLLPNIVYVETKASSKGRIWDAVGEGRKERPRSKSRTRSPQKGARLSDGREEEIEPPAVRHTRTREEGLGRNDNHRSKQSLDWIKETSKQDQGCRPTDMLLPVENHDETCEGRQEATRIGAPKPTKTSEPLNEERDSVKKGSERDGYSRRVGACR